MTLSRFVGLVLATALAACGLSLTGTGDTGLESIVAEAGAPGVVDAAAAVDAGPQTIAPSDPGLVACGTATCKAGSERCCADRYGTNCRTFQTNCGASEYDCDEQPDCTSGYICCLGPDPGAAFYPSTKCYVGSCRTPDARVCKSDAECDAGTCIAITCGSRVIGTCGGTKPTVCP